MATSTASLASNSSNNAQIRLSAGFIESMLTSAGWVQTADTGQTAAASLVGNTNPNTSVGYQIWRMNDTLQATKPVYMKIEFGAGPVSSALGIWFTFGTSTNGAGTLTGQVGTRMLVSSQANSLTTLPCYASGSTNRLSAAMFFSYGTSNTTFWFSVERSKDANLADSGDGVIFQASWAGYNGNGIYQFLPFTGTIRAAQTSPCVPAFGIGNMGSLASGNQFGALPILPYDVLGPVNPGLGALVYYAPDTAQQNNITVVIKGVNHTYMTLGTPYTWGAAAGNWTSSAYMIRYE